MKIRNDFVTNSSSASYILGKAEDVQFTRESVYQIVRKIYLDLLSAVKKRLEENADSLAAAGVTVTFDNGHNYHMQYDEDADAPYFALDKALGEEYESMTLYSDRDFNWLDCGTYEEYLRYLAEREERGIYDDVPFYIYDFSEEPGDEWAVKEAVYWYKINIDSAYLGKWFFRDNCEQCDLNCGRRNAEENNLSYEEAQQLGVCKKWKEKFQNGTEENLLVARFGKIMISSDHELFMPFPVHKALAKIAAYGCCHMG